MHTLRKLTLRLILLITTLTMVACTAMASTGGGILVKAVLDGSLNQIKVDSSRTVVDSAFFNTAYIGDIDTAYSVQNLVTLKINEASSVFLHDTFSVTVQMRISYSTGANDTSSVVQSFTIHYDSAHSYNSRSSMAFKGAHMVTVKILSVTSTVSSWDPTTALLIENQLVSQPDFAFTCTNAVSTVTVSPTGLSNADELPVSWTAVLGADQYDLEWTYVDSSAIADNKYGVETPGSATAIASFADNVFLNNATRITTTGTTYNIPLIYDNTGTLFIRVRPVQLKPKNAVVYAEWSSDADPLTGLGQFTFRGHQRPFNWQSNISFAEEGKRKVVVQYYDGSLRSRQTVTKDNTTDTTIVGETYYDYQGRPVIQVMPTPTLSNIIQYTANFNVSINGTEYSQTNYDTLINPGTYCSIHADTMSNISGSSNYYSPLNPKRGFAMNQFIPDAKDFPFSETVYTPDNTGRISKQGGVGPNHYIGSGHETKYYYGTPDQNELDALFGTEVGDHSHYFKNMVRDANGQYSISYVDMHGRTIATALAGVAPGSLAALPSNTGGTSITETLADSNNVFLQDQSMTAQKTLVVPTADSFYFSYNLNPAILTEANCSSVNICYTCRYDLEITISDNCNNQLLGGQAFDTLIHNYTLGHIFNSCTDTPMTVAFTKYLMEGSYVINKKLTVNHDAYDYYRDSVYLPNNTCVSLQQYINNQKAIVAAANSQCSPDCLDCQNSVGTWAAFQSNYMAQGGIPPSDSASYRNDAMTSYQAALASCAALCQTNQSQDNDILNAMLQDVTPPYGQYADTNKIVDVYSIFYSDPTNDLSVPAFKVDTLHYFDQNGNPDTVYNSNSGLMVTPNSLSMAQFVQNFKPSWAYTLLKFHPEYCKLEALEAQHPSELWDRQMESVDSYTIAYARGYLNPTGSTAANFNHFPSNSSYTDPLSTESGSLSGLKGHLESKMNNYMSVSGFGSLTMWGMACLMVHCTTSDAGCVNTYNQIANDFNPTIMCQGDLDMAWRNFREIYLQAKQDIVNTLILAPVGKCADFRSVSNQNPPNVSTLLLDQHQPEFTDVALSNNKNGPLAYTTLSNFNQTNPNKNQVAADQASVQDSLNSYYTQNCNAYVNLWTSQLSPCNYSNVYLTDSILPRLNSLCRLACDSAHPYGASTLPPGMTYNPPGTSYHFTSFQDIINAFNQLHGITNSLQCNAELITAPLPYGSQPIYGSVAVYSRPTDCECKQITSLYQQYQNTHQGDASFSAYLSRTLQVTMTDANLTQLLSMCNYTTNSTCVYMSQPILLPPAFQCNSGSTCVPCLVVDSMYTNYTAQYPGNVPDTSSSVDTIQFAKNQLFQNYMNNRLGFNLQAYQYLNFMDSCHVYSATLTDSLKCSPIPIGNTYKSGGTDTLYDIRITPDNGYIMAGGTTATGAGDGYIVKTDHSGNTQWAKTYGGTKRDYFYRIKPTADNGYIAIGTTYSVNAALAKILLVKMDFSGNLQWTKVIGFGTAAGEFGRDVIQTSDGGYAALGSYNYAGGTADLLMSKLDTGGNILWTHQFGTSSSDEANSLYENGDTLLAVGSAYISGSYQGAVYKIAEDSGTVYKMTQYEDDGGMSTWFGNILPTATGYRVNMNNTTGFTSANQHIAYVNIGVNDSVQSYIRSGVPPGGNTIATYGVIATTQDGGTLITQTGDVTSHIFWQRLNDNDSVIWSSVTNLPGTQTLWQILQNPDTSFTTSGTDNGHALFLDLNAQGKTGCYDSTITLGVTSLEMNVYAGSVTVNASLVPSHTDTTYTQTILMDTATAITCPGNTNCSNIYNGPMLCGKSQPLFPSIAQDSTTSCTDSTFFAVSKGTGLSATYTDSLTGDFEQRYLATCMQAYKYESFTVTHAENEYHYTLYYYDQAGNLLKTVPPAGVHPNNNSTWLTSVRAARAAGTVVVPNDSLLTSYRYNSLNQVVSQLSPDGGQSSFWYDRLGRLSISQNAKQAPNSAYSFTEYDSIGRITEVGELTSSTAITDATSRNATSLATWINNVASTEEQITQTNYDYAFTPMYPEVVAQNLRNRVAWTGFFGSYADVTNTTNPTQAAITYYSYDILGNVDTLVQEYRSGVMKTTNNSLKKTVYDYDLQSGKVDKVTYQHGYPDAFYHIYQYDAENRLTNVQTSADSVNWDNDAYYSYYLHGPLSRTILGDQQVQGINYAYTLQGWMKEVNPPIYSGTGYVLQPDGSSGSEVASNAYNLLLNYYDQDYAAVSPITSADNSVNTTLGTSYRPLYNGNISSMGVNVGALGHPLLYNYQYDQLNRLVHMDAWNNTGSTWSSSTILPDFQENVAYDPNGNILQYKRNGNNTFAGSNINMDSLNYAYTYGTNKLDHISDNVASGNYPNDIDNQSIGNYTYDAIGELTADNASGITGITWTVYGKINTITKSGSTIAFTYDPAGNRISKTVTASGNTITTWYVRDAQGNVMSIYTAGDPTINSGDLTQTEVDMYGSSRLGLTKCNIDLQTFVAATQTSFPLLGWGTGLIFTRGNKLFELSNHLGNVLATISDKKIGVSLDGTTVDHFNPLVLDANDYYPFGSLEPGRTYAATSAGNYRYGFNGKENDNEVKGLGDQIDYGKRIYDPRVGRFLSLDPYYKKYPELTPYQFASNTPLQAVDLDGLEKYIIHYRPHDGKDNIVKVVTNNSIIYTSISIEEEPVLPAVVQFVKEDKNGNVISRTGEIPLKNYGSTLYVGPDNPKYESGPKKGTDRYDLPAINSLDAAAKKHDLAYDKERVAGITGALFSLSVLPADKQLIKDAQAVIDLYNKNQKDPVNKQPVSTLTVNAAKNVVASFTKIVAEKEAQISILNATNEIKTNAQTIVEAIKAALTVPIH